MKIYEGILNRLRVTRRKETLLLLAHATVAAMAGSSALALVFIALESVIHGGIAIRTSLAAVWAAATLGALVWLPLRVTWERLIPSHRPTLESIAYRVGKFYPDVRDRLLNALQLVTVPQPFGSRELAHAAFAEVSTIVGKRSFDVIIDPSHRRKILVMVVSIVGIAGLVGGIEPLRDAAWRLAQYNQRFVPPPPFTLHVQPLYAELLRNSPAQIVVRVDGTPPADLKLYLREELQNQPDPLQLKQDSIGRYHVEIPALKSSIEYYAAASWYDETVRSAIGQIKVSDYPMVRSLRVRVEQPSYSKRPVLVLDETNADIIALRGSRAYLHISANKAIVKATAVIVSQDYFTLDTNNTGSDTNCIECRVTGETANCVMTLWRSGNWWIELRDSSGRNTPDPQRYTIRVESDAAPTIALVEPSGDVDVGRQARVPIRVTIGDDYGFTRLVIRYKLIESRYTYPDRDWRTIEIPLPSLEAGTLDVPYVWDLNLLGISPQDKYEFYLEVFDNDLVSGPKSAKTNTIRVRLPSLEEVFRQAQQAQQSTEKQLQQVQRKAEELARTMDELQRELLKQQQPNWQTEKSLESALRQQEELQQKLQQAQQTLQEMTQLLNEHKAISPETLQKYMELQKLLQQVNSEELRQAIEAMQRALKQLTPHDIERAMRNFRFDEEQFRKNIERALQLLKRLQAEQKIDELQKRAEQLAQRQQELERATQNTNPNNLQTRQELSQQQEQLQREFEQLQQEYKELERVAQEAQLDQRKNVADQLRQASEQLQQEQQEQSIQSSREQLQQGNFERARQSMQRTTGRMQRFSDAMKRARQEIRRNQVREIARQLQQAFQDISDLSKQQERLAEQSERLDPNSTAINQAMQRQQQLREQLMNVARRLDALSQRTAAITPDMARQLGESLRSMQEAQRNLEQRNPSSACRMQQSAMSSLNSAMSQMQALLEQLSGNNPGPGEGQGEGDEFRPGGMQLGTGFMQRLMEAAGMQQQINSALDQLGENGQRSSQQREQLGRIAAQQGRVMKSIEELAREQKQSGGTRKALGDLEHLADQMREVLTDLQTGTITPDTRRKLDRILSRLLDATRSMHERDYEKTRQSRPGEDVVRQSPSELRLRILEQLQRYRDFLRTQQLGYSRDYEILIERYLEYLQRSQQAR